MRISVTKLPFIREISLSAFFVWFKTFIRPDFTTVLPLFGEFFRTENSKNQTWKTFDLLKINWNWTFQRRNQRTNQIIYDIPFDSLNIWQVTWQFFTYQSVQYERCVCDDCEDIHNILCAWSPFASPIRIICIAICGVAISMENQSVQCDNLLILAIAISQWTRQINAIRFRLKFIPKHWHPSSTIFFSLSLYFIWTKNR